MNDAAVEEFDTMATWTADAVEALGGDHALPAACRGSGSPAALDWLIGRMGLTGGARLLDSGAGTGGPAEFAAVGRGVQPVLAEPMVGACRAARRMFGRPVVAAEGGALPVADGAFDAAWSLGVLCTVPDQDRHLAELARAVRPGGAVGLLVFVRQAGELPEEPEGNRFPSAGELEGLVRRTGLTVLDRALIRDFPASPPDWQRAVDEVNAWIEQRHGDEEGFRVAQDQQDAVVRLIESGLVAGELLVTRAAR